MRLYHSLQWKWQWKIGHIYKVQIDLDVNIWTCVGKMSISNKQRLNNIQNSVHLKN